jgi:hypothetical protein
MPRTVLDPKKHLKSDDWIRIQDLKIHIKLVVMFYVEYRSEMFQENPKNWVI